MAQTAAKLSESERAVIEAQAPRLLAGVTVYRVARELTAFGGPLAHRDWATVKRHLSRLRQAAKEREHG